MKTILLLTTSLLCSASAMESNQDKETINVGSENPAQSSPIQESPNPLENLWKRSLHQNDAQAQYELFCIFKDGLYRQKKNPNLAIQCGLKARNRPDPYPCVIEELPRYLYNLYLENLHLNPSLANSYLIQGANLCPYDGYCIAEDNMAYIGNHKSREIRDFIPTGYTNTNQEVITGNISNIQATYKFKSEFCPEYLGTVNSYIDRIFSEIDLYYSQETQPKLRINFLHRINMHIERILDDKDVLYMLYRKILLLCCNHKIASDYCDQFKDNAFIKVKKLANKLGVDTAGWPLSYTPQNKTIILKKMKIIEGQILSFMQKNYYLPGFIDIANAHVKNEEYEHALKIYCHLLKHVPLDHDALVGIYDLDSKMKKMGLITPKEPFDDLRIGLKNIIESPLNYYQFDASATYTALARGNLIKLDPNETILSLTLKQLKTKYDVVILTEIGDIYSKTNDLENAYKYYLLAAETGEMASPMIQVAKLLLGRMSSKSEFPEKDALDWYKNAAATGNPFAKKLLARLELMHQKRDMPEKVVNLDAWSINYNLPKPKKQNISKKSKRNQKLKQQVSTTPIKESSDGGFASINDSNDVLEIVDNFSELEIELFAMEMGMENQVMEENEAFDPELALQEELKQYGSKEYPPKLKKPKTLREQMRKMAMIHQLQQVETKQSNQDILIFDTFEYEVLDKIFDLSKPVISDKEFIKFASCDALEGIIKIFKTKSGYALVAKTGQISEETAEGLTAGTHWNHTGKRDGLDWHFVAEVRSILECLEITPMKVKLKSADDNVTNKFT